MVSKKYLIPGLFCMLLGNALAGADGLQKANPAGYESYTFRNYHKRDASVVALTGYEQQKQSAVQAKKIMSERADMICRHENYERAQSFQIGSAYYAAKENGERDMGPFEMIDKDGFYTVNGDQVTNFKLPPLVFGKGGVHDFGYTFRSLTCMRVAASARQPASVSNAGVDRIKHLSETNVQAQHREFGPGAHPAR